MPASEAVRDTILYEMHDAPDAGHADINKTLRAIRLDSFGGQPSDKVWKCMSRHETRVSTTRGINTRGCFSHFKFLRKRGTVWGWT
jgi:hypothetical protein